MPKQASEPPMSAEPELDEMAPAGSGAHTATDDELKDLVAEALLIAAIERRQAKAAEQRDTGGTLRGKNQEK